MKTRTIIILIIAAFLFFSCESGQEKKERLEQVRIELKKRFEVERIESAIQTENDRKEKEIYIKYIFNSLHTGATPYSLYYGGNPSCNDYDCSQLKVTTSNSDVLVIIKKNNMVIRHAFIQSGDSYTFSFPNGTYQPFFYYGKGWNPEKEMKNGKIKGGFITNEDFGKDDPQSLYNNILEYSLILQHNGNFSTKPSNPEEAL